MDAEEENPQRQDGDRRIGVGSAEQHQRNRLRQQPHTYETGDGDEIGDPHRRRRPLVNVVEIAQRESLRHRRHQAGRQRRRQNGRHVDKRHRHPRQITEQLGRLLDGIAGRLKAGRHDQQIDIGHQRQHDIRQRHRQRQAGDTADDAQARLRLRVRLAVHPRLELRPFAPEIIHKDQQPRRRSGSRPEARAGGGELQAARQQQIRQHDHRHHAEKLLHDLRDRRRRHHLQALEIAAVARQHRHEENSRRQRGDSVISPRIADEMVLDQPTGPEPQQQRKSHPRRGQHDQRNAEDAVGAPPVAEGDLLGDDDRNRHRDAG